MCVPRVFNKIYDDPDEDEGGGGAKKLLFDMACASGEMPGRETLVSSSSA